MNTLFAHLVERISLVTDERSANKTLAEAATQAGFMAYVYLVRHAATKSVISNLPEEWRRTYRAGVYDRADPVLFKIRERPQAFIWNYRADSKNRRSQIFVREAAKYGIRSGISVPINTGFGNYAVLSLISDQLDFPARKHVDPVVAAAAVGQIHSRLATLNNPVQLSDIGLKPSELRCLRWSAEGKSMRAIAVLEELRYSTICFHLRNAKEALGVTTLSQATAVATALKLI